MCVCVCMYVWGGCFLSVCWIINPSLSGERKDIKKALISDRANQAIIGFLLKWRHWPLTFVLVVTHLASFVVFTAAHHCEIITVTYFNVSSTVSLFPLRMITIVPFFFFFFCAVGSHWACCHMKTPLRQTGELHIKGRAERNLEIWWWEAAHCSVKTLALLGVIRVHWQPVRKPGWSQERPSSHYILASC